MSGPASSDPSPKDLARSLGLERAAELFPGDIAAAHAAAMANRAMLPPPPPATLEPWQPPGQAAP